MQKVTSDTMEISGNSIKKYFNFDDIRIMIAEHYNDLDGWHKHEFTSQIIFVIEGIIEVLSKNSNGEIVMENEFIIIPAQEWHRVNPKTKATKFIVIKYKSNNINIIKQIKNDYVRM